MSCCLRRASSASVRHVSGTPPAPGELGELREVNAGLRAANARLRELLAAKDAQIEALTGQLEELRAQVADLAAQVRQNSSRPPSSAGWASRRRSRCGGRPAARRAGPRASRARPGN